MGFVAESSFFFVIFKTQLHFYMKVHSHKADDGRQN